MPNIEAVQITLTNIAWAHLQCPSHNTPTVHAGWIGFAVVPSALSDWHVAVQVLTSMLI